MTLAQETATRLLANNEDEFIRLSLGLDRQNQVRAFHKLYECPIHGGPVTRGLEHMSTDRIALRLGLNLEETKELFLDGFGIELVTYFKDPRPSTDTYENMGYFKDLNDAVRISREDGLIDVVGATDALADISYVSDGFALEMGVNLDENIDEVHASNMTKPGEDGKPVYRADGKVLKGPFYVKPDIEAVIFKKEF